MSKEGLLHRLKPMRDGFYLSLMLYAPLSIVSYFNEVYNGCFSLFVGNCPRPPAYYHLPRLAALFLTLTLLVYAWRERGDHGSHGRGFSKGVVLGTILGALIFLVFWMGGFWGWEHLFF